MMKTKNVLFLLFIVVVIVGLLIVLAPSISQMNANVGAINQSVESQR